MLGYMSFIASTFWLAFFMQELQHLKPLTVAVHMIPQCVAGLIWNVIAGNILHRVNNTLLMAIGAVAYFAANLLLALMGRDSVYWAFMFPSLVLNVVGADFQFNVANVTSPFSSIPPVGPPHAFLSTANTCKPQMYVMQSLPSHQQGLAGGIFNTVIRLSTTVGLGITTAVYSSVAITPQGLADPMLKFTRTWDASVAVAGAGILALPFIRLGTQGNTPREEDEQHELVGRGEHKRG